MPLPKKARLALALAGAVVFLVLFLAKVKNEMHDFQVNDTAGRRLIQGETIYRPWKPDPGWENDGHWQFKYSPFSALVYAPLSALPLTAAKGVWYILVLASMVGIVGLAVKLAAFEPHKAFWPGALAVFILAKYFLREIQLGQINAFITVLLLAMTALLVKQEESLFPGGEWAAGLLWGLASALKPYAVIFFPYFILKRKWKALAAGIGFLGISFCLPIPFYGVKGNLAVHGEWISSLSESTPGLVTSQDNVSLLAFFAKWTSNPTAAAVLFAATVVILGAAALVFILRGARVPRPVFAECALLVLFIPLLSPLGWDYTFLAAFPAVVIILRRWSAIPGPWKVFLALDFAVIAFSLYDLLGRRLYGQIMSWSVPTVNFVILAAALLLLRLKRTA